MSVEIMMCLVSIVFADHSLLESEQANEFVSEHFGRQQFGGFFDPDCVEDCYYFEDCDEGELEWCMFGPEGPIWPDDMLYPLDEELPPAWDRRDDQTTERRPDPTGGRNEPIQPDLGGGSTDTCSFQLGVNEECREPSDHSINGQNSIHHDEDDRPSEVGLERNERRDRSSTSRARHGS